MDSLEEVELPREGALCVWCGDGVNSGGLWLLAGSQLRRLPLELRDNDQRDD